MEKIPGKQEDSAVYVYQGYGYHLDKRGPSEIYRCATRSTTQCQAAASVWNGEVDVYTPHGGIPHQANPTMVEESQMKQEMLQKCRDTNMTLKDIFDEVCRGNAVVAVKLSFISLKPSLERERAKCRPPIPHSLEELGIALEDYAPTRSIYRGMVTGSDGSVALLFASDGMLEALSSATEAYIDGTFKVTPNDPPVAQMYTIHMRIMDTGIPAMYALTSSRTTPLYKAIFERVVELAPGVKDTLQFVMGDYERAAMSAIRTTFPDASLHGCWFHFNQAVLRMWRQLGLHSAPTHVLSRVMTLPLAPSDRFNEGLVLISRLADEIGGDHPEVLLFMRYLRTQWTPLANVVSVYGCSSRTNNLVESFHQTAQRKLGGLHTNIWKFLGHLADLITDQSINLARLLSGRTVRRLRPVISILNDAIILDAQEKLALGRFSLAEFLLRCSTRTETWFNVTDALQEPVLPAELQPATPPLVDVAWMSAGEPVTIAEALVANIRGRRGRASRRNARVYNPSGNNNDRDVENAARGLDDVVRRARGRGIERGRRRARGHRGERGRGVEPERETERGRGVEPEREGERGHGRPDARAGARGRGRGRGRGRSRGRGRRRGRGVVVESSESGSARSHDASLSPLRRRSPPAQNSESDTVSGSASNREASPSPVRERRHIVQNSESDIEQGSALSREASLSPLRGHSLTVQNRESDTERGPTSSREASTSPLRRRNPVIQRSESDTEQGSARHREASLSPSRGPVPITERSGDNESIYHFPEDDYEVWLTPAEEIPYYPVIPIMPSDRNSEPHLTLRPCSMCKVSEATHAFVPCGHRCSCEDCVIRLEEGTNHRCPLCRLAYSIIIRIRDVLD